MIIKGNFDGKYEIYETKLIGMEALWEIVLLAKSKEVYQNAS